MIKLNCIRRFLRSAERVNSPCPRLSKSLIVFDLDGTLINSLDDLAISANHVLREKGYPEHELSAYRRFVGNGIAKLIERALPPNDRSVENVASVCNEFVAYYSLHKADCTAPYEGIVPMLRTLKERGLLLAVASNKFHTATVELVAHYFGEGFFDFVYGQRDGIPPKPDPTVVFDILKDAGVEKSETLYVGDSGVDMRTASNADVCSIGVTWGFRDRAELLETGACHIVDHPSEILKLI